MLVTFTLVKLLTPLAHSASLRTLPPHERAGSSNAPAQRRRQASAAPFACVRCSRMFGVSRPLILRLELIVVGAITE
jgi:hypothetical protein